MDARGRKRRRMRRRIRRKRTRKRRRRRADEGKNGEECVETATGGAEVDEHKEEVK